MVAVSNVRTKGECIPLLSVFFVRIFFSAITPSASGGQPMQLYFMKKDKLPLSVSTLNPVDRYDHL